MENNLVAKGNVGITGTGNSLWEKLYRVWNHPVTRWVGGITISGLTLLTGYKMLDNITSNGYDGSINLLDLVKIDLTKHDKS